MNAFKAECHLLDLPGKTSMSVPRETGSRIFFSASFIIVNN